jgi:AcrR family transcriptional regulator
MSKRMTGAGRRDAIVRCAIQLFAQRGFRGTTTRELAAALGVTEPVLYRHFRNKRELYDAIVEAKSAEVSGRGAQLRALAAEEDDGAFFRGVAEAIARVYRDDPDIPRLLLFSALEGDEHAELFFERFNMGLGKLVASYIRRRIRQGGFRNVNAQTAARAFIGMISQQGLAALLLPGRFEPPDRRAVEETVGIFLEGIVKR